MTGAYYNEHDPKAAAWLRVLIEEGQIAPGVVDERNIQDVRPNELSGYRQCHFFAGIGGWSLALRLAGWPDDKRVWTGSCPCQPFSCAGRGMGADDERHLWPDFRNLIGECGPAVVFGEQVASKDGFGWLAGVRADLEAAGYRFGAADLCAAGVGSPQRRQRLFWVADSQMRDGWPEQQEGRAGSGWRGLARGGENDSMAYTSSRGLRINGRAPGNTGHIDQCDGASTLAHSGRSSDEHGRKFGKLAGPGRRIEVEALERKWRGDAAGDCSAVGPMADPECPIGRPQLPRDVLDGDDAGRDEASGGAGESGPVDNGMASAGGGGRKDEDQQSGDGSEAIGNRQAGELGIAGAWHDSRIIRTSDGKARRIPVEPAFFPLVDGFPARVAVLKGFGNAIVPQVAAVFIRAAREVLRGQR